MAGELGGLGMTTASLAVGYDELATLRLIALAGGLPGEAKVSCAGLAEDLDVSTQTVSRRLQRLESAGLLDRETVSDGQWTAVTEAGEQALRREYQAYRRLFETPDSVELRGRVTGGMGEGRHYRSLPGYREQFLERLGYEPFPGTLNIDLTDESVRARAALSAIDAVPIDAWEDDERTFGPASCYPATVEAGGESFDEAHAIVPERTHHDESQLELIAPVKLRDELGLGDGDRIEILIEGHR